MPNPISEIFENQNSAGYAFITNQQGLLPPLVTSRKTLVDIAKSQDAEVGDGTTSVVLEAGEILKQVKPYVEEGVHARIIIKAIRKALQLCMTKI
ncbi:T-complex protein 1 subunit eta-like [Eurosta solidaginis]|uniref:T-complex protein 1 subunit eta-like n=1 Tax=Eurosta solidaginis TaxID=178769 RepID=UPI00353165BA